MASKLFAENWQGRNRTIGTRGSKSAAGGRVRFSKKAYNSAVHIISKAKQILPEGLPDGVREILEAANAHNYKIESFNNGYQWRIGEVLDLHPKNKRWHHIPFDRRGSYEGVSLKTALPSLIQGNPVGDGGSKSEGSNSGEIPESGDQ